MEPFSLAALWPRNRDDLVRIVGSALVGGVAAWVALGLPGLSERASLATGGAPSGPIEVTLAGVPLVVAEGRPTEMIEPARAIARAWLAGEVGIDAAGARGVRTREELGAAIDQPRLAALVAALADRQSALRRAHAQHLAAGLQGREVLRLEVPSRVDPARALAAMIGVKDDLDKAAVDARLDLARRAVRAEEEGRRLDVYGTLAAVDDALAHGAADFPAAVERLPAVRTAASIGDVAIDEVLGFFETKYTPDKKHADRTFNLRLAASKLDGHVVMPGETFDFNEVVGPRSEANGYRVAPVIAQGELVDGIGGGTCQVAGTLHGAAFFAGLDIVERRPHTRPSFYIKMGMDATVVYPTITLRLRNPFPHPVVLHETVAEGVVRAEILGPKRTRDVTFIRKIDEVVPFAERETPDPKIPAGERVLAQRGIPGFKVTRYRILRDGSVAVREHDTDVYPPTSQIWHVGTGEDVKGEAAADDHPEYVADEYLAISQGPHVVDPHANKDDPESGPMVETRIAGRYGTHGWTVREGFAKRLE